MAKERIRSSNKIKKIAITGGKGGTGKSTYSILLAKELLKKKKRVLLCDCDIECPNDYLLLEQKLVKPIRKIYTEFPRLNKKKCKKCGLCVKACRSNAIFQAPGKYPVFIKSLCSGCGACWTVCPYKAIETLKEEIGQIFVNKVSKNFWLITGQANPGLEETGPVVTDTKSFVLGLAKKFKPDYILFDTAAGTHCPVISALLGCDFATAVTEPTPMGAYDLNLILGLCQKIGVPVKIVLNQADMGDKKRVQEIAARFKVEIEREFPYSEKIAKAYSMGKLFGSNL